MKGEYTQMVNPGAWMQEQERRRRQQQRYGAIAYSASTGNSSYSWDADDRAAAERAALAKCAGPDAMIVMWDGGNFYIALAEGEGAVGAASDQNQQAAERQALLSCRKFGGQNCRITLAIHTVSGRVVVR
jgi:Domain of unknown function (DUF4189)